jgi:hypothetical protein
VASRPPRPRTRSCSKTNRCSLLDSAERRLLAGRTIVVCPRKQERDRPHGQRREPSSTRAATHRRARTAFLCRMYFVE